MRLLTLVVPGIASLLATAGALAHHAFATEFDVNRQVTLEGKVTKVELINPHSWIHIEVIQDGKPVTWMVEAAGARTHSCGAALRRTRFRSAPSS